MYKDTDPLKSKGCEKLQDFSIIWWVWQIKDGHKSLTVLLLTSGVYVPPLQFCSLCLCEFRQYMVEVKWCLFLNQDLKDRQLHFPKLGILVVEEASHHVTSLITLMEKPHGDALRLCGEDEGLS